MTGYAISHLGREISTEQYISGIYHHDRCGRRLKLFVYCGEVRRVCAEGQRAPRATMRTQAHAHSCSEHAAKANAQIGLRLLSRIALIARASEPAHTSRA